MARNQRSGQNAKGYYGENSTAPLDAHGHHALPKLKERTHGKEGKLRASTCKRFRSGQQVENYRLTAFNSYACTLLVARMQFVGWAGFVSRDGSVQQVRSQPEIPWTCPKEQVTHACHILQRTLLILRLPRSVVLLSFLF
jgi:hypothetical protein